MTIKALKTFSNVLFTDNGDGGGNENQKNLLLFYFHSDDCVLGFFKKCIHPYSFLIKYCFCLMSKGK